MLTIEVNQEVNILSFSFLGLLFPMGSECWYLPETKVNIFPARTPLPDHSEGFSFHLQACGLPTQGIMLCRRGPPPFFPSAIGRSFGVHLDISRDAFCITSEILFSGGHEGAYFHKIIFLKRIVL
jgi:hypothetical protein